MSGDSDRATQGADLGLTVAECLTIAPMNRAKVMAGAAGLSRRLRWVHVIDHNDFESALSGGELVLTSGVTLCHDESLQRAIFPMMRRLEIAGLVIALGPYMHRVPRHMVLDAERHSIPVIVLPWDVNFRDVTHALLTRLVQSHYAFLESAERLNRDLLEIVLRRGGLAAVCARLGTQLGRSAAVCDPAHQVIVNHEHNRQTSGTTSLLAGDSLSPATLDAVARLRGPSTGTHDLLAPGGRVLGSATPVLAASRLTGWLLVESIDGEPSPRVDVLATESAAMIIGLLMVQAEDIARAGQHRADDLLFDALHGATGLTSETICALGLEMDRPCLVSLAAFEAGHALEGVPGVARRLMARLGLAGCVAPRGSQLVAVVQGVRFAEFGGALARSLQRAALGPRIALSRVLPRATMIPTGYREANETLRLGRVLFPERPVLAAEDTAALALFLRGAEGAGTAGAAFPAIARLRTESVVLVETLEVFLENEGKVSLAARTLGIHRHTMLYRLERITERLGTELESPARLELRLQLLAWRLAGCP
jgi:purine catabolism regulator